LKSVSDLGRIKSKSSEFFILKGILTLQKSVDRIVDVQFECKQCHLTFILKL